MANCEEWAAMCLIIFFSLFSNSLPQLLSHCGLDVFLNTAGKGIFFYNSDLARISNVAADSRLHFQRCVFPGRVQEVE